MRVAVFLWGPARHSVYREPLLSWAAQREGLTVFSDEPRDGQLHYLRCYQLSENQAFDLSIHEVSDCAEAAVSFPFILERPAVLLFSNVMLHAYARATSHAACDPWGFAWIVRRACPDFAGALIRLAEASVAAGALARWQPLAPALLSRAAAAAVPDWRSWLKIGELSETRVDILPPGDDFGERMERALPGWLDAVGGAAGRLRPLEHPHANLAAVERERVLSAFDPEDRSLAELATRALAGLFGGCE